MNIGGASFEHVWAFQIKCMMSNQYSTLVEALKTTDRELVMAACLRLGWNDAFRHVSENNDDETIIQKYNAYFATAHKENKKISDDTKNKIIFEICENLVQYFEEYAKQADTVSRHAYIIELLDESKTPQFVPLLGIIKKAEKCDRALCFGHIQKMFNIAMKVLLCLVISYEEAVTHGYKVILKKDNGTLSYLTKDALLSYEKFKDFSFYTADCPIDSYVLKAIDSQANDPQTSVNHPRYSDVVWSKFGTQEDSHNYINIQEEIKNIQSGSGKSNLCFDLENWNS